MASLPTNNEVLSLFHDAQSPRQFRQLASWLLSSSRRSIVNIKCHPPLMFTPPLAFGHGIIIVSWICLQHIITRSQPTGCPYIMVGDWGRNCKGKQCLTEQWTRSSTPQYACHLFRPPMNLLTHPTQPFSTETSLRARKGWTKLIQDKETNPITELNLHWG